MKRRGSQIEKPAKTEGKFQLRKEKERKGCCS